MRLSKNKNNKKNYNEIVLYTLNKTFRVYLFR